MITRPFLSTLTPACAATEIAFDAGATAGVTATRGIVKLDGTETVLFDGRTARASLDAGWLAVTNRRPRNGGFTNVMREAYIPLGGALTVWRKLNVERPDGGPDTIDCGNHTRLFIGGSNEASASLLACGSRF